MKTGLTDSDITVTHLFMFPSTHTCGSRAGPLSYVAVTPWPQTGWSDNCRPCQSQHVNDYMFECSINQSRVLFLNTWTQLHLKLDMSSVHIFIEIRPSRFFVLEKIIGKIWNVCFMVKDQNTIRSTEEKKENHSHSFNFFHCTKVKYPLYIYYHLALVTSVCQHWIYRSIVSVVWEDRILLKKKKDLWASHPSLLWH